MKNLLKSIVLILVLSFYGVSNAQQTEIEFLSGSDAASAVKWNFFCTDGMKSGKWNKIDVPSNWELQGFGHYNYGHDNKDTSIVVHDEHGLYKHQFEVPASWKGKTVNIVFDGSMTDTKVKINGTLAGDIHQGSFYRFKYDITKLLKYGKTNQLEVDVAKRSSNQSVNKAEREADFWIFGGIFRPVFLEVLPETHMKRTAIDARADGSFKSLIVLNKAKTNYYVEVNLFDKQGNKIGKTIQVEIEKGADKAWVSGKFDGVKSWNPEWPTLYNMKISLKNDDKVLHEVTEKIGFRTVELRKHDGFYINNEKVIFKGVNRHSFWPETGRCLSEANILQDINLIKEMNMNAVRCSHYVPDKRFLELCDSMGLFVLNEVTGWQDGYDTVVGPKIIKETILKDENHPCVVIWDHGNEGGWMFENEKWYHHWDIQKRPVICPWLLHNDVETFHYPAFNQGIGKNIFGNDPFMPTELLHGLYDGGHGAGLEEYWRSYESSPLLAGGFLWVLSDEAVLRTDKKGTVYDTDGNHAPDGILGPHREKEASFYTIKEIWSPVQIKPIIINKQWSGKLFLENKYIYTNLKDCVFTWKAISTKIGSTEQTITGSGIVASPNALPGETALVKVETEGALQTADIFEFKAINHEGYELYTWSWPVVQAKEKAAEYFSEKRNESEIEIIETTNVVTAKTKGIEVSFNKKDGTIKTIKNTKGIVSFSSGLPTGILSKVKETTWKKNENGNFSVEITYSSYPKKAVWTLHKSGLLQLEANQISQKLKDIDFIGITFNYPEEKVKAVKWMGRGPYRVWKNRLKGSNIGVWGKDYNNTVTGESFNNLIYPEFKGYHGSLYWATLETSESDFTIITETPNLYFHLFTPEAPKVIQGDVSPVFPEGDISFLHEIPAIGTKFKQANQMGPKSIKGQYRGHPDEDGHPIKLWFDFTSN